MLKLLLKLILIIIVGGLLIKYAPLAARAYALHAVNSAMTECISSSAEKMASRSPEEVKIYMKTAAADEIRNCSYVRMSSFARNIIDPRQAKFEFDERTGSFNYQLSGNLSR